MHKPKPGSVPGFEEDHVEARLGAAMTKLRAHVNPQQYGSDAANAVLSPLLLDGLQIGLQQKEWQNAQYARNWSAGWAGKPNLPYASIYIATLATLQTEIAAMDDQKREDLVKEVSQYKTLYCVTQAAHEAARGLWKQPRHVRACAAGAGAAAAGLGGFRSPTQILSTLECWAKIQQLVNQIQASVTNTKPSIYATGSQKLDCEVSLAKRVLETQADGTTVAVMRFQTERKLKLKKRDGLIDTTPVEYKATLESRWGEAELGAEALTKFQEGLPDDLEAKTRQTIAGRMVHGAWCATMASGLDVDEFPWAEPLTRATTAAQLVHAALPLMALGGPMRQWLETTNQPGFHGGAVYANPPGPASNNSGPVSDMCGAMKQWVETIPEALLALPILLSYTDNSDPAGAIRRVRPRLTDQEKQAERATSNQERRRRQAADLGAPPLPPGFGGDDADADDMNDVDA